MAVACAAPATAGNFGGVAGVIQLVECQLPKLDVAGSSPVARSWIKQSPETTYVSGLCRFSGFFSCFRGKVITKSSRKTRFVSVLGFFGASVCR